jgi:hypothetical protein
VNAELAYLLIALLWSSYQGWRGIVEQGLHKGQKWFDDMSPWKRLFFLYLHDFAFRFICVFAGFSALAVCWNIVTETSRVSDISAGGATLLIASFFAWRRRWPIALRDHAREGS